MTAAGVNHEHVISGGQGGAAEAGSLAYFLRASLDPTADRARSYNPKEGGKRLEAWRKGALVLRRDKRLDRGLREVVSALTGLSTPS